MEQKDLEPKEEAIRKAAEDLFLDKGFNRTSMSDIARKAQCNQALIHYYFRTKEKLFNDIFIRKLETIFSSIAVKLEEDSPFEEILTVIIERQYDMLLENPRIPLLILTEIHSSPDRVDELEKVGKEKFSHIITQFNQRLTESIQQGKTRPISPITLYMNIVSLNAAMFLGKPLLIKAAEIPEESFYEAAAARKQENIEFILRSLRP